jgi:hypothetical protein
MTVGGSQTVQVLAVDRPPVRNFGRCAITVIWVVEGYKSHPNQPIKKKKSYPFNTRAGLSLLYTRATLPNT